MKESFIQEFESELQNFIINGVFDLDMTKLKPDYMEFNLKNLGEFGDLLLEIFNTEFDIQSRMLGAESL